MYKKQIVPKKKYKKFNKLTQKWNSPMRGDMSVDNLQKVTVWRGLGIVPDVYRTKLKYNELLNRGPVSPIDTYVFNANSVFDPNQTGTGSQPTGFDQLMGLYYRCLVLGCKIKIKLANQATVAFYMSVVPTVGSSTSFPTGYNDAVRLPYAKSICVGGIAGSNVKYLSSYVNCGKFVGNPKSYRAETNYYNTSASGPLSGQSGQTTDYFVRWFINATSGDLSTNMTYFMDVELTYYCEFTQRVQLSQS